MATSFRIKQLEDQRWVPNHPGIETAVHYSNGENQNVPFSAIRNSIFHAVNEQHPDEYTLDGELDNHKEHVFSSIDKRTREKIGEGFIYEGMIFSLSSNAQTNYTGMLAGRELLDYPVTINARDDTEKLQLDDEEAVRTFCGAALKAAREYINLGSELKEEVRQAQTAEDLDDIAI